MAVNPLSSMTKLRLTGMSSGMDTDSIVQNLMQIEQLKLNRHLRTQKTNQWKLEMLKSNYTDVRTFRQTFMSALNPSNMLTASAYKTYSTDVTGSYASAVSVKANANASVGSVTINYVSQLAKATSINGGKFTSAGTESIGESNGILMSDISKNFGKDFGFEESPVMREQQVTDPVTEELLFDDDGNPVMESVPVLDENGEQVYELTGEIKIKIGTDPNDLKEITIKATDDLQTVMSKINNSDAGVTLSYSRLTDSFTLSAKDTGEAKAIYFNDEGEGNFFGAIGLNSASGDGISTDADGLTKVMTGKDAIMSINGTEVKRSSNTFTIDGLTYTLNETTTDADGETINEKANIRVNVKQDVDAAVDKIKTFINAYNSLIAKLDAMLYSKKEGTERSYIPLTDEEKSAMTEKEVDEWEAIAKKGIMYNDADLKNMLNSMRSALQSTVEGVGLSMNSIGFSTGSFFDGKRGQIVIDETKLRNALEKDADQVMRVFCNSSDSADPAQKSKETGFLFKISDIMYNYERKLDKTSTVGLEKSIKQLDEKITNMQFKMYKLEEKYYKQYAAMETALSKMDSQSNWISSMLGAAK